jgi:hypothetical protein
MAKKTPAFSSGAHLLPAPVERRPPSVRTGAFNPALRVPD